MGQAIICLMGAFVGAGFASGREIVQFFSRWGALSWPLAALAAGIMAALMLRVMGRGAPIRELLPGGRGRWAGTGLMLLLLTNAGGGMTAAAGELAALTLPIMQARTIGGLITLILCAALTKRSGRTLGWIGRLLLPAMGLALFFCLRLPAEKTAPRDVSAPECLAAAVQAAGYAGMNVLLAMGVLCDAGAGRSRREQRAVALGTGAVFFLLLCLYNAAFLRRAGDVADAALPTVLLLRAYGKWGYALSALVLYLAVASTLIAVLRGLSALIPGRYPLIWSALLAGLTSQLGFRDIVGKAYPILGWAGILLLAWPAKPLHDARNPNASKA